MSRRHALPGFGRTLGVTMLFMSAVTLLPLAAMVFKTAQLSPSDYWRIVGSARALATYKVTFGCAALAAVLDCAIGLLLAWILVRYEFPGRKWLDALMDLPFALPTAVAGISLAALTGPRGWMGGTLAEFGIKIAYAWPGVVLAMMFTSFPFVVRAVQPVLADLQGELEEAASTLGATPWQTFRRVILPEILPSMLGGASLAFVRALGEFGAVVFIAGNLPFRTEITSLLIFVRIGEFDYVGAAALATFILGAAFAILLAMNFVQWLLSRRMHATA